ADGGAEEALHLLAQAVGIAALAAAAGVEAEVAHERGKRGAQLETAAAGANRFGRQPEEEQARQRSGGVAAGAVRLGIPAGPDREGDEAVAPLPDRHVAGVGVRQRHLHDLAGDERTILVAGLGVLEDRRRGVDDPGMRRADDRLSAGGNYRLPGPLHAI